MSSVLHAERRALYAALDIGSCRSCAGSVGGRATCGERAGGCALRAGGSKWCVMCAMGAGGHALYACLYAVLYSGCHGGRTLFAGGAEVMCYVLEAKKD